MADTAITVTHRDGNWYVTVREGDWGLLSSSPDWRDALAYAAATPPKRRAA